MRPVKRYKFELMAGALLVLMAANLVSVTARKSITADEIVLIPAAYYHWVDRDVNLIGQHPPLCKLLAGLPLLFIQPDEWKPASAYPRGHGDEYEWDYVVHFWRANRALFQSICFWSRLPMIGLTLALGVLLFCFARDLLGGRAAVLAVALYSLEPTILAHGRVVQTDIAASFGLLATVYAVWRYLRAPGWRNAFWVGVALGIAIIAKYSMLAIGPPLLVGIAILWWRARTSRTSLLRHCLLALVTLLVVINAAYFFHNHAPSPGDAGWIKDALPGQKRILIPALYVFRWVLPTDLIIGIYWQLHHARVGHPAGLLGSHSNFGWWYYFPVAFFFKATIPFLVLSIAATARAVLRVTRFREWLWVTLLVPLALYTALMMTTPINIGVRYYLPAYLFFIALAAAFLDSLWRMNGSVLRRYVARGLTLSLMAWVCFEAWWTYPNYTPYLNQLAFARPHWWYLSDSNVEWGDDARELAVWLQARGETRVRGMLLGGFATLDFYQINYVDALSKPSEPLPRYTAIGASFLNGSTNPPHEVNGQSASDEVRVQAFASYRNRKPEAIIGNSIYIFRDGD